MESVDSLPQAPSSSIIEEPEADSTSTESSSTESVGTSSKLTGSTVSNPASETSSKQTNSTVSKPANSTATKPTSSVTPTSSNTSSASKPPMPTVKQETPPKFPTGYITTEKTYIETEYVIFEIDPQIYVIGDLAKKADIMCAAMEKVTGLSFKNEKYGPNKVHVKVDREGITGEEEYSTSVPHAIQGECTTARGDKCSHYVYLNPVDLFLGKGTSFLHEMSHALRFCQSGQEFKSVFEEGIATYIEYETAKYLEKYHTDVSASLECSKMVLYNLIIDDDRLYSQTMEFWLNQDSSYFDSYGNDDYSIGYRFFTFLKATKGNPFKWIGAKEATPEADMIALVKSCYGTTVFTDFYSWMKQHEQDFAINGHGETPNTGETRDFSGFAPINFYPRFLVEYNEAPVSYFSFRYKDLYINLEEAKKYLTEYKGKNIDNCYLSLSHKATVYIYDKQGKILDAVNDQTIPIKGVSYVKLVGSGYMGCMRIDGYHKPSATFDTPTVIWQKTIESNGSDVVYYALNEILTRTDLEIIVETSSPISGVVFESVDWANFTRKENVSRTSWVGGCRTITIFNDKNKDINVKVVAKKIK